jgi:hypothetical protein
MDSTKASARKELVFRAIRNLRKASEDFRMEWVELGGTDEYTTRDWIASSLWDAVDGVTATLQGVVQALEHRRKRSESPEGT